MMILGTGVGTSAVCRGHVERGVHGTAGLLGGHFPIQFDGGRACNCGGEGCLEAYVGTWALKEMAGDQSYDYRRFAADYAKGGEKARRLFATVSAALGAGALAYTEGSDPFGPLKSTPKACKIGSAQTLARPSGSASPNLPSASLRCIPASPDASRRRATNKFPFPVSRLLPAAPKHGVFESQRVLWSWLASLALRRAMDTAAKPPIKQT